MDDHTMSVEFELLYLLQAGWTVKAIKMQDGLTVSVEFAPLESLEISLTPRTHTPPRYVGAFTWTRAGALADCIHYFRVEVLPTLPFLHATFPKLLGPSPAALPHTPES